MISVQECIVAGGFEHSGHFQLCIEMPHNMAGAFSNMADMQLSCSTYIALCQLEAEISRVPRCRSGPRHRHSELVRQVKFFHAGWLHRAPQPQGSATGIWPEALKYYALLSSRDDESVWEPGIEPAKSFHAHPQAIDWSHRSIIRPLALGNEQSSINLKRWKCCSCESIIWPEDGSNSLEYVCV